MVAVVVVVVVVIVVAEKEEEEGRGRRRRRRRVGGGWGEEWQSWRTGQQSRGSKVDQGDSMETQRCASHATSVYSVSAEPSALSRATNSSKSLVLPVALRRSAWMSNNIGDRDSA